MPLYHCKDCHHEWEEIKRWRLPKCDWCGGGSYVIEEETPLERMLKDWKKILPKILPLIIIIFIGCSPVKDCSLYNDEFDQIKCCAVKCGMPEDTWSTTHNPTDEEVKCTVDCLSNGLRNILEKRYGSRFE